VLVLSTFALSIISWRFVSEITFMLAMKKISKETILFSSVMIACTMIMNYRTKQTNFKTL